jgi:hypothetical protein
MARSADEATCHRSQEQHEHNETGAYVTPSQVKIPNALCSEVRAKERCT